MNTSVTILCPRLACRAVLRVPDRVRGKKVRCPECGNTFIVPNTTGPSRPEKPGVKADAKAK